MVKKTALKARKFANTTKIIAGKVALEPVAYPKRVARMMMTDPRRVIRLVRGREANPAIIYALEKRAATYAQWISENEPSREQLDEQRVEQEGFKKRPLISILTPVFNPPTDVLEELIQSVLDQTYPNFELCLGDFGDKPEVRELIERYAQKDERVKLYVFENNLGISGNSNQLLKKVKGDFIGLLDHDDLLSPDALFENVKKLNESNYDFIYSDKDLVDERGNRYEPLFKPELSHETMLNANYLTHFDIMRTSVVKKIGGWDPETDGAQDWDLFLRIMLATDKFAHIPKILYHWRVIATSTAHSIDTKPYALAGQRKAVQKYLDAKGYKATPKHNKSELLLEWDKSVIDQRPLVVIHGHDPRRVLRAALSVERSLPKESSTVVLFNGEISERAKSKILNHHVDLIYTYNPGELSKTLQKIVKGTDRKNLFFVHDDVELTKNFAYEDLAGWLSIDDVRVVGGKLIDRHTRQVVDAGSTLTPLGLKPLFHTCPGYYNGYVGNLEWVRNVRATSLDMFMAKIVPGMFAFDADDDSAIANFMINASANGRLVSQPKVIGLTERDPYQRSMSAIDEAACLTILAKEPQNGFDRFSSPYMRSDDQMLLDIDGNPDDNIAIKVEGVSKAFRLPHEKTGSIKNVVLGAFNRKRKYENQRVLKNISFEVKKGEFFGIVGRNGSGKSTLLKLLAGIYAPDKGEITINGKLTPFIELGVGFNQELSGRENVFLNGALLGFSRAEMETMYDDIVAFAELERFMDQKLKNYSSGMQVRLAFSIAIRAESDILVLDEVLAVGDEAFQRKCNDYFAAIKKDKSKTIILVTHGMDAVRKYCTQAMLISDGKIEKVGSPDNIANHYTLKNFQTTNNNESATSHSTGLSKRVPYFKITSPIKDVLKRTDNLIFDVEYQITDDTPVHIHLSIIDEIRNVSILNNGAKAIGGAGKHKLRYSFPLDIYNDCNLFVTAVLDEESTRKRIAFTNETNSIRFAVRNKLGNNGLISASSNKSGHWEDWEDFTYNRNEEVN